jgi:Protein of unknown function (DUF3617)
MTHPSRTVIIGLLLLAGTAVVGALTQGGAINIRTGQWEITTNGINIPDAALAKLPEGMRDQFKAQMSKPQTSTSCVTADDLKDLNIGKVGDNDDSDHCKVTSRSITRTTADITRECTGGDVRTLVMHVDAPTPTALRASIKTTNDDGTMTMAVTGKWLSATCKKDE